MSRSMQILAVGLIVAAAIGYFPRTSQGAVSFGGDTSTASQLVIGNSGFGTFRIDGGSMYIPSVNSAVIGSQTTGIGFATVTDPGSLWTWQSSGGIDVGSSGVGRLEILNGGAVTLGQSGQFRIGVNSSSQGTVVVKGSGSLLSTSGTFSLGTSSTSGGSALLQISDNGIVNVPNSQTTIWAGGRVELSGGLLRTSQLTQNGVIIGSGEVMVQSTSSMTNNNRLEADADDLLKISGSMTNVQNLGVIAADGGEIEFQRAVTNSTSGSVAAEISLRDAVVRTGTVVTGSGAQLTNSANLTSTGGTSDFYGRVTNLNNGHIAVTNHSVLLFHDDVTADGGVVTVFAGSSAVFLEDLTLNAGSTLLADLTGTNPTSGFGHVEVVGTAQLAGNLAANLSSNYTPHAGDTFTLVTASSLIGSLSLGAMPVLPNGLMWDLDAFPNRLDLSVVPGLAGDYSGNGIVDAADYIIWRQSVGQTGMDLPADGNSDGKVDSADYDFWRGRIGNSLAGGLGAGSIVPEPGLAIFIFAGLILVVRGGRKLH